MINKFRRNILKKVKKSIRLQLILSFFICLAVSALVLIITLAIMSSTFEQPYINYSSEIRILNSIAHNFAADVNKNGYEIQDKQEMQNLINWYLNNYKESDLKIYIQDKQKNILFKSNNIESAPQAAHNSSQSPNGISGQTNKEIYITYPLKFKDNFVHLYVSMRAKGRINYRSSIDPFITFIILVSTTISAFVLTFMLLTQRKMRYLKKIAEGLFEISKGDLDFRLKVETSDELGSLAGNINFMAKELQNKIEEERKAERTKNELITNISHDLRTPLTSIMGYLKLMIDEKHISSTEQEDYLKIAYGKSEKLQALIEDLFEYTKLTNESIKLDKQEVCINELLAQIMGELLPSAQKNSLEFSREFPDENIMAYIDPLKIARVFENLLVNAIRYSHKPGVIEVKAAVQNNKALVCFSNKGDSIPDEDLPRIFDRFYRIEKARTSDTGGSGLGLAIAKSIVELHKGEIKAECEGNEIRFIICLPLVVC